MLFGVPAATPAANGNAQFGGQAFQFAPAVQSNAGSAQVSNAGVGFGGSHQHDGTGAAPGPRSTVFGAGAGKQALPAPGTAAQPSFGAAVAPMLFGVALQPASAAAPNEAPAFPTQPAPASPSIRSRLGLGPRTAKPAPATASTTQAISPGLPSPAITFQPSAASAAHANTKSTVARPGAQGAPRAGTQLADSATAVQHSSAQSQPPQQVGSGAADPAGEGEEREHEMRQRRAARFGNAAPATQPSPPLGSKRGTGTTSAGNRRADGPGSWRQVMASAAAAAGVSDEDADVQDSDTAAGVSGGEEMDGLEAAKLAALQPRPFLGTRGTPRQPPASSTLTATPKLTPSPISTPSTPAAPAASTAAAVAAAAAAAMGAGVQQRGGLGGDAWMGGEGEGGGGGGGGGEDGAGLGADFFIRGTCEEMCPEAERLRRVNAGELHILERVDPANSKLTSPELIVKKSVRNYDDEDKKPSSFRTLPALNKTMEHLRHIMDRQVSEELSLLMVQGFLWDRYREIRREVNAQRFNLEPAALPLVITWNEEVCRFLLACSHELIDDPDFLVQLNQEQMNKVLMDLLGYYSLAHQLGIPTPCSAEFKCYHALMLYAGLVNKHNRKTPNKLGALEVLRTATPSEQASPWTQVTLAALGCLSALDVRGFMRLLLAAPYTLGCVLYTQYPFLQVYGLAFAAKAYDASQEAGNLVPVSLISTLGAVGKNVAQSRARNFGAEVVESGDGDNLLRFPHLNTDRFRPTTSGYKKKPHPAITKKSCPGGRRSASVAGPPDLTPAFLDIVASLKGLPPGSVQPAIDSHPTPLPLQPSPLTAGWCSPVKQKADGPREGQRSQAQTLWPTLGAQGQGTPATAAGTSFGAWAEAAGGTSPTQSRQRNGGQGGGAVFGSNVQQQQQQEEEAGPAGLSSSNGFAAPPPSSTLSQENAGGGGTASWGTINPLGAGPTPYSANHSANGDNRPMGGSGNSYNQAVSPFGASHAVAAAAAGGGLVSGWGAAAGGGGRGATSGSGGAQAATQAAQAAAAAAVAEAERAKARALELQQEAEAAQQGVLHAQQVALQSHLGYQMHVQQVQRQAAVLTSQLQQQLAAQAQQIAALEAGKAAADKELAKARLQQQAAALQAALSARLTQRALAAWHSAAVSHRAQAARVRQQLSRCSVTSLVRGKPAAGLLGQLLGQQLQGGQQGGKQGKQQQQQQQGQQGGAAEEWPGLHPPSLPTPPAPPPAVAGPRLLTYSAAARARLHRPASAAPGVGGVWAQAAAASPLGAQVLDWLQLPRTAACNRDTTPSSAGPPAAQLTRQRTALAVTAPLQGAAQKLAVGGKVSSHGTGHAGGGGEGDLSTRSVAGGGEGRGDGGGGGGVGGGGKRRRTREEVREVVVACDSPSPLPGHPGVQGWVRAAGPNGLEVARGGLGGALGVRGSGEEDQGQGRQAAAPSEPLPSSLRRRSVELVGGQATHRKAGGKEGVGVGVGGHLPLAAVVLPALAAGLQAAAQQAAASGGGGAGWGGGVSRAAWGGHGGASAMLGGGEAGGGQLVWKVVVCTGTDEPPPAAAARDVGSQGGRGGTAGSGQLPGAGGAGGADPAVQSLVRAGGGGCPGGVVGEGEGGKGGGGGEGGEGLEVVSALHVAAAAWLRGKLSCGRGQGGRPPPSGQLLALVPALLPLPVPPPSHRPLHSPSHSQPITLCLTAVSAGRVAAEQQLPATFPSTSMAAAAGILMLVGGPDPGAGQQGGGPGPTPSPSQQEHLQRQADDRMQQQGQQGQQQGRQQGQQQGRQQGQQQGQQGQHQGQQGQGLPSGLSAELHRSWSQLRCLLERLGSGARVPVVLLALTSSSGVQAVAQHLEHTAATWPPASAARVACFRVLPLLPQPAAGVALAAALAELASHPPAPLLASCGIASPSLGGEGGHGGGGGRGSGGGAGAQGGLPLQLAGQRAAACPPYGPMAMQGGGGVGQGEEQGAAQGQGQGQGWGSSSPGLPRAHSLEASASGDCGNGWSGAAGGWGSGGSRGVTSRAGLLGCPVRVSLELLVQQLVHWALASQQGGPGSSQAPQAVLRAFNKGLEDLAQAVRATASCPAASWGLPCPELAPTPDQAAPAVWLPSRLKAAAAAIRAARVEFSAVADLPAGQAGLAAVSHLLHARFSNWVAVYGGMGAGGSSSSSSSNLCCWLLPGMLPGRWGGKQLPEMVSGAGAAEVTWEGEQGGSRPLLLLGSLGGFATPTLHEAPAGQQQQAWPGQLPHHYAQDQQQQQQGQQDWQGQQQQKQQQGGQQFALCDKGGVTDSLTPAGISPQAHSHRGDDPPSNSWFGSPLAQEVQQQQQQQGQQQRQGWQEQAQPQQQEQQQGWGQQQEQQQQPEKSQTRLQQPLGQLSQRGGSDLVTPPKAWAAAAVQPAPLTPCTAQPTLAGPLPGTSPAHSTPLPCSSPLLDRLFGVQHPASPPSMIGSAPGVSGSAAKAQQVLAELRALMA